MTSLGPFSSGMAPQIFNLTAFCGAVESSVEVGAAVDEAVLLSPVEQPEIIQLNAITRVSAIVTDFFILVKPLSNMFYCAWNIISISERLFLSNEII
ncbi:hypothetical protein D3C87_1825030 [compost metagenome]